MRIIAITPEAKKVLDSLRPLPCPDCILREDGLYDVEVEEATLDRLDKHCRKYETYSDTLIRLFNTKRGYN